MLPARRLPHPESPHYRRLTHRPSGCVWSGVLFGIAIVFALAVVAFIVSTPLWIRVFFAGFSAFAILAVIELTQRRIELGEDRLTFFANFRRRSIPRADIDSVTWAKGGGVSLKLVDGTWVHLPEVGSGSQGLTNSIRAWLRRTANPDAHTHEEADVEKI
jgi:hypothetical protein